MVRVVSPTHETTTDADGKYRFENLLPGEVQGVS